MEKNLGNVWGWFAHFIFVVSISNTMLDAWKEVSKYRSFAFNMMKRLLSNGVF